MQYNIYILHYIYIYTSILIYYIFILIKFIYGLLLKFMYIY